MASASVLVVVFGLPGSGKSTLSRALASSLNAEWISSDDVRSRSGRRGDYSRPSIAAVYGEMFDLARPVLSNGGRAVLDASFSSRAYRDQAEELARSSGVPLVLIRLVADERRALGRVRRKRRLTDAGPRVYRLLKQNFDPVDAEYLELDSSWAPKEELLARALRYVESRGSN